MARARAKADASARAALDEHEAELPAAGSGETAFEFRKRLDQFVHRHSDDDGRSEWERMKAKNRLRCWRTLVDLLLRRLPAALRLVRDPPHPAVQRRRRARQDEPDRAHPGLRTLPRPVPPTRLALRQARRRLHPHPRPRRHPMAPSPGPAHPETPNSRAASGGGPPIRAHPDIGRQPLHQRRLNLTRTAGRPPALSRRSWCRGRWGGRG